MATSGVVGGSTIDVQSLVKQLVAAERAPLDAQISREKSRVTTQISALGALMGSVSAFQTSLTGLKSIDAFNVRKATTSDAEVFTAAVTSTAEPGSYDVEVVQLAKAQQLSSTAVIGGSDQPIGTGQLTLTLGTTSFTVNIDSTNNTLAGIRSAINAATDNPGVRATIINAQDGAHLVLTSAQTGATNAIQVAQAGGDGGLSRLEYSALNQANYTELAPAQNAIVRVATLYEQQSATNSISGVIDGVTLNLLDDAPGETLKLTVSHDNASAKARITEFVTAYNALRAQITKLGGYNATTKAGGPMQGDALLNSIDNELRRTIGAPVESSGAIYQTLSSIGISTQADGTLKVDSTKLDTALNTQFASVASLFGGSDGVAAKLYEQTKARLADGAPLDSRSDALTTASKALDKRASDIDARMALVQSRYLKQFTALDSLLSSLQTTSSYLSQQIDALSNLTKSR